jgi:shikimate dehydrogenase
MQNAALAAMEEDAVYAAFDVSPERLRAALDGLSALGAAGANLTIPHKEAAVRLVDAVLPEAEQIGAVNTIRFEGERRVGTNTDGAGFLMALRDAGFESSGRRAVILGAGGSARAVAAALAGEGADLVLANRTPARAEELAASIAASCPGAGAPRAVELGSDGFNAAVHEAELLVNTTPVGMQGSEAAPAPVPEQFLKPELFVYDLVYSPPETPLLAAARRRGCRAANGLSMLARQGALALEFWLGRPAPVAVMEKALWEALGVRP